MFAFNTLTVILSILVQGQEFLSIVGNEKSLRQRLDEGNNSDILIEEEKWLCKYVEPIQLKNEWKILKKLNKLGVDFVPTLHPMMMKKEGKISYLKMGLIDNGATLFDYLEGYQKGLVSIETVRDLIIQVKRKLDYLNNLKIFHHDCHVWNFLVNYEEGNLKVYIIDFGLSSSKEGEDFASFCQSVEDVFFEEDSYITDILDEVSCLL